MRGGRESLPNSNASEVSVTNLYMLRARTPGRLAQASHCPAQPFLAPEETDVSVSALFLGFSHFGFCCGQTHVRMKRFHCVHSWGLLGWKTLRGERLADGGVTPSPPSPVTAKSPDVPRTHVNGPSVEAFCSLLSCL